MSAAPLSTEPKTIEDLFALEEATGERYEIIDGQFVEKAVSDRSSEINSAFNYFLFGHVRQTGSGKVYDSEMTYELLKSVRRVGMSVILADRLPTQEISRFACAPDVVVEVVSPTDRFNDIRNKVQEWLDNGARLVWLATPSAREVTIFRRGQRQRTIGAGETLDGEDVLPGFSVEVDLLFPSPVESRQKMPGS